MTKLRMLAALTAGLLAATLGAVEAYAAPAAPVEARNVVLIHGAWPDGSRTTSDRSPSHKAD